MAIRHKTNYISYTIEQDSPFLNLPGEIRMLIYRAALLSLIPLDLAPNRLISHHPTDGTLETRLCKAKYQGPRPHTQQVSRRIHQFRDLEDLRYIRQEMAIALVQTCKQVNREAKNIFWTENTFRFSADFNWTILRRFLTTIGPEARSRLRCLDVVLPGNQHRHLDPADWSSFNLTHKCHPTLHMTKLLPFQRGYSGGRGKPWEDNVRFVCATLEMEQTLKDIRIVIPDGFTMHELPPSQEEPWNGDELHVLQKFQDMHFMKTSLLIEKGGRMDATQNVHLLSLYDLDVIAMPGSFVSPQSVDQQHTPSEPTLITTLTTWKSTPEPDYLTGLSQYFDEDPLSELPARGGKATKNQGSKKLARKLKGFGGCRFVNRVGLFCWDCEREVTNLTENWNRYQSWCGSCRGQGGYRWKEDIEVRKLKRDSRRKAEGWN
ncbi:hypothetical protein EJ08DRAFT_654902 [Tothia fuscella]|uniref:DUF7730 domain-containing protein n=1 Tax=Tothia fuscella TaxID=1048955 RepID=A0A9P4U487_9PEZI|nr:hypothetical protein EJ08DRAFT_654902 [Tothia fuscella]